jgi:hypothetical protein
MEPLQHFAGIVGAVAGTLLPVSASRAVSPAPFWPAQAVVVAPSAPVWRPWIDDMAGKRPAGDATTCRTGTRDGILPLLLEAPLPEGYDPGDTRGEMYACILVAPAGGVAAVRLGGTTGDREMDKMLVSAIGYGWRFAAGSERPEWVRVRLDAVGEERRPPLRL